MAATLLACSLAAAPRADAFIYWANGGTNAIGRADLGGGHVDQGFIRDTRVPCEVAVDDSHIYWNNRSGASIGRADLDGSQVDNGFISFEFGAGCGVAVDSAHVYWVNEFGSIGRANLDGSNVDQNFIATGTLPAGWR